MAHSRTMAFGAVATCAWAGEAIFVYANAQAYGSIVQSLWRTTAFLTDWSGILVAVTCTAAARRGRRFSDPGWIGLATVAIMLVGIMFAALGGWGGLISHGVGQPLAFSSLLAHVLTPGAMLIVWIFAADHGRLRWRNALWFMLFPLAYLLQMFARGILGGGYPYPEIDVGRVGWTSALVFAGSVTLLYLVLGLVLVWVDGLLARRPSARLRAGASGRD